MDRSRTTAWGLTIGAAVVFAASMVPMARRIGDFNAHAGLVSYHAEPIVSRTIRVEGFPEATLIDVPPPAGQGTPGMSAVGLEFAGVSKLIPVKKPPAPDLPGLAAYDEWLKVLATYEVVRDDRGERQRKEGSERLMIVVRRTPEGYDPEAMGEVRRIDWVFDFYDLTRDGKVKSFTMRWPRKDRSEKRLHDEAANAEGKADPKVVASAKELLQYEPLRERTLEYFAAMFVIPKLAVPDYKFTDTAFNPSVLGWTLPASMGSVLVFAGGLVFALAPRRKPKAA